MKAPPRLALVIIALTSCIAGAVVSLMPALVVGLLQLFYNTAGGFLLLLGRLVTLVPDPAVPGQGRSSLPPLQYLGTESGLTLLRSATGTALCAIAAVLLLASRSGRREPGWLAVGLCCGLAAVAGGWTVAATLAPALAASGLCLLSRRSAE